MAIPESAFIPQGNIDDLQKLFNLKKSNILDEVNKL
jgi:hypothetical protein